MTMPTDIVGTIVAGSLQEGLSMRVAPHVPLETIRSGLFVAVQGERFRFFSLITDVRLAVTHNDVTVSSLRTSDTPLHNAIRAHGTYALALIRPLLMLDETYRPLPVTAVPAHFAPVTFAHETDMRHIFGDEHEQGSHSFALGTPVDMQVPVCVDLKKVAERSTGVFGKTGTGKTFMTRLMLAGLVSKRAAVCLIFDMHNEYGSQARTEGSTSGFVKGLKTLFPERVALFSLDPTATQRRGITPDRALVISYQSIDIEDILALQEELNLHSTAYEAAYLLAARYKSAWLQTLLSSGDALKELAQTIGAHPESIAALYRKLKYLERLACFQAIGEMSTNTIIEDMIALIDRGMSIIIEFGQYTTTSVYLLVANIITRRIHELYTTKTEQFLNSQRAAEEPQQLVIVIEEAHKFLNPAAARQTTFGIIAREMRKYYVSLLIVDQRPSSIDPEVLSQVGTKFVAQLSDEKDIQAVTAGMNNQTSLRSLFGSLGSRQQAVLFGHAIPMPILIETRRYDEQLYRAVAPHASAPIPLAELIHELY